MKKHKQENVNVWMEEARELAKAERELQIDRWIVISIEYRIKGERILLHRYDLPREIHEKYRWVIRWRQARCQCLYPRESIEIYYSYYDNRTGMKTDFNSCLSKLAASKAQITIAKKWVQEYLCFQKQNNLFFDENTDEDLVKFRAKLKKKEDNYNLLYQNIQYAAEKYILEQKKSTIL